MTQLRTASWEHATRLARAVTTKLNVKARPAVVREDHYVVVLDTQCEALLQAARHLHATIDQPTLIEVEYPRSNVRPHWVKMRSVSGETARYYDPETGTVIEEKAL